MSGFEDLNLLGPGVNDASSIGTVLEAFFYGLYCLIFGQYLQVYRSRRKDERSIFIYPLTLLFLLSTLYFILSLPQTFWLVLRPGTHQDFIWNVDIISVAIYGFADFISQAILIYRCWILWNHLPPLVVVPLFTVALTLLGIILVLVVELCRQSQSKSLSRLPHWTFPLAISSFCISLALNTIVTGLLVLRIAMVHTRFRRAMANAERRPYDLQVSPIISILIETGMMTFVSQLLLVIVFGLQSVTAIIIGSPMIMIYGMTPTVVIVRVTMGTSYNANQTSRIQSSMTFVRDDNAQSEAIPAET